jgi:lipoate-protein ligase A
MTSIHPSSVNLDRSADGHTNMARDVEILARAEHGGVHARVYTWDGPWVSLGRFQRPERALKSPIDHVVRPTGGKAVLHGHDFTVSIAANLGTLGIEGSRKVATVYRAVVGPLVRALNASGMEAVLAERTDYVRNAGHTADCFAHVSPNDVVDPATGEKVCGCALRVTESAVLLQASIPVSKPLVDPATVFDNPHVPARVRDLDQQRLAEALRTILGSPPVNPLF